jgi:hypothetical protein
MFRGKSNYPDLDILDSPLLSPTAGAPFSTIPPSALADRIFNDPESWGDDDTSDNDFPQDVDDLTWLTEELEKVVHSAGMNHSGTFGTTGESSTTDEQRGVPASSHPRNVRASAQRVTGKKGPLRPISLAALFDHENEDFSGDIQQQISKILESGGIPHHIRPIPRSSALSPPSTGSSSESSPTTPLHIHTGFSSAQRGDISPSPINVYSASATLSFLEWYGIYPDTPRNGRRSFLQPKSALSQKTPILQVPSPRYAPRPSSLLAAAPILTGAGLNAPQQSRADSVPPVAGGMKTVEPQTVTKSLEERTEASSEPPAAHTCESSQEATALQYDAEQGESCDSNLPSGPPPYSQTPLPQPPIATGVATEARSVSESVVPSREGTPSRSTSRRLPRIPPGDAAIDIPRTATPPLVIMPAPNAAPQPPRRMPSRTGTSSSKTRSATPPQPVTSSIKQPVTVRNGDTSPATSVSQADNGNSRMSSIRSPPGGPAGPRTRGRLSRDTASTSSLTQKTFNIRQA